MTWHNEEKRLFYNGFRRRWFGLQLTARVGNRGVVLFRACGRFIIKFYKLY